MAPLIEAAGSRARVAAALDSGNVARAVREGLTDVQADRWAVALGLHPAMVWPGWFDAALRGLDAVHVAEGWRQAWLHDEAQVTPEPFGAVA